MRAITIAIADDHDRMREWISEFLQNEGFQILIQAPNGAVLLEKINSGDIPDVCILDVRMPVMDGPETCAAIKERFPSIKVIAHSMNNEKETIEGMYSNGADKYIIKGAAPSVLSKTIRELHQHC